MRIKGELPQQGFTLAELLVVTLLLEVLAAIAIPQYFKVIEKSRAAEAIQYISNFRDAEEVYLNQQGSFAPPGTNGLADFGNIGLDLGTNLSNFSIEIYQNYPPPDSGYWIVLARAEAVSARRGRGTSTIMVGADPAFYGEYYVMYWQEDQNASYLYCEASDGMGDAGGSTNSICAELLP